MDDQRGNIVPVVYICIFINCAIYIFNLIKKKTFDYNGHK